MIPTISKPTRVTKHTAAAIDNIITKFIINSSFKSAMVKMDLSDHFPMIFINFILALYLLAYTSSYPFFWLPLADIYCLEFISHHIKEILYVNTNSKVKITEMKAKRHACLFVSDIDVETSCFFNEELKFLINNFYFFSVS